MPTREKSHRLPHDDYRGEVTVAFTARVDGFHPLFKDGKTVRSLLPHLRAATEKHACLVAVYCFMPDHAHLILHGQNGKADVWQAMVDFKQRSGFWLAQHHPAVHWQKDFYDHILRGDEDLATQVRYVAGNPVRKGLVTEWREYPHTGAMGIDLEAVMNGVATM